MIADAIGMFALGVPILGSVIGGIFVVITAGSSGPRAAGNAVSGAFFVGWFIAAIIFGVMVAKDWIAYEDVKERFRAAHRKQKTYMENVERSNAEYEREQKIKAEKAQREYEEREVARQKTIKFLEESIRRQNLTDEWAAAGQHCKQSFEAAYQGLAFRLAAEQGITNPADVTKVFAQAFPHLPISTDWRLGILRFDAVVDPRIKAVLHHLPDPIEINDFEEFKRRNSHLFKT